MSRSLAILCLVASLAAPSIQACVGDSASPRSLVRACFANQKTLVGAMEMWSLDENFSLQSDSPLRIDKDRLRKLVEKGYVQHAPADPGVTPETTDNIFILPSGDTFCLIHGSMKAQGTARVQLDQLGINDPMLLALASPDVPPVPPLPYPTQELVFTLLIWLLFEATCAAAGRLASRSISWAGRITTLAAPLVGMIPAFRSFVPVVPALLSVLTAATTILAAWRVTAWSWKKAESLLSPSMIVKEVRL